MPQQKSGCLIVSADTLIQRLAPAAYVQGRAFELTKGDRFALPMFRSRLVEAGYVSVGQVTSPGEFAVRGSLLDVYPMGAALPLRIDLFDDVIEAIRRFDPDSQRSLDLLERVRMLPAREMPLDADGVRIFRRRFRARFEGEPTQAGIYRGVSEGLAPAGIEFYLPLFFESTATLFDYLPRNAVLVRDAGLSAALARNWQDIQMRYEERRYDIERPVLAPPEIFLDPASIEAQLASFSSIELNSFKADLESALARAGVHNFPTRRAARAAHRCARGAAVRGARQLPRPVRRAGADRSGLGGTTRSAARDAARPRLWRDNR